MLIDAHCHLMDRAFEGERPQVLERARAAGVGHIVVIGESRAAAEAALDFADGGRTGVPPVQSRRTDVSSVQSRRTDVSSVPGTGGTPVLPSISVVAGLHPHDAKEWSPGYESWLRGVLARPGARALGEIGLDYHYDHSPRDVQRQVFDIQLALAQALDLPVVIHAREADDDLLAALRNFPKVRAVLHSFSSGMALLEGALALGHSASFSGMVTFKNWTLDDAIRLVPAGRLMVETDSPYLAPVPHRGKRNEPSFVKQVAERVAVVRGESFAETEAHTMKATKAFFGIN